MTWLLKRQCFALSFDYDFAELHRERQLRELNSSYRRRRVTRPHRTIVVLLLHLAL